MLKQPGSYAGSWRRPPRPDLASCALFLDLDGTLLEFAPTPMAVAVPALLPGLLCGLRESLGGALALISGRSIAALDQLIGLPTLAVAGLHGLERRDASARLHRSGHADAALAAIRPRITAFADAHPGVLIEDKGIALGLHYRSAPAHRAALAALAAALERELPPALTLQRGHEVIEIRPTGPDKGDAVLAFMAEAPFTGRRPLFIGDDQTDEHAFAVVNPLGGITIKVGRGDSAARYRLASPTDVLRWLAEITPIAAVEGAGS